MRKRRDVSFVEVKGTCSSIYRTTQQRPKVSSITPSRSFVYSYRAPFLLLEKINHMNDAKIITHQFGRFRCRRRCLLICTPRRRRFGDEIRMLSISDCTPQIDAVDQRRRSLELQILSKCSLEDRLMNTG